MNSRMEYKEYMMNVARIAAGRSTCPRRKVGCVLVRNKRIISTGYNGSLPHSPQCNEVGCLMYRESEGSREKCIRTIHAEINALTRAREVADEIFVTDKPCLSCLKAIFSHNKDIKVYYWREYPDASVDTYAVDQGVYESVINIGEDYKSPIPTMSFEGGTAL